MPEQADKPQPTPDAKEGGGATVWRSPEGIALCLSGGGYRATLFHLGALRRLNELGLLRQVKMVTSVSGGSITAAFLATAVARKKVLLDGVVPTADWDAQIAVPLREFSRRNIRTWPILKGLGKSVLPWNIFRGFLETSGWRRRLLPWNWFLNGSTAVKELEKAYEQDLTHLLLHQLPISPQFVLCATEMYFGVNWEFERDRMGDYQVGDVFPVPADWPLARAVAASSCFPPVFNPLPIPAGLTFRDGKAEKERPEAWAEAIKTLRLTDGGNYDNMALEPAWNPGTQPFGLLLVSDAGGLFGFEPDKDILWRVQRYQAIQERQSHALRQRWLFDASRRGDPHAAYWSTRAATASYEGVEVEGYSKELARDVIAEIRTDLDAFSDAEIAVLENHGYCLAEAAVRAWVPQQYRRGSVAPFRPPFPGWMPYAMSEDRIRGALKNTQKRRLLGRW